MKVECIARFELHPSGGEIVLEPEPNVKKVMDWLEELPVTAQVRVDNRFQYPRGLMAYWEEER